ncbi:hypothetical protein PLICRDRAFT_167971 [Plicaturopsis crispa FD-325 SS-3]|uniref:DUF7918 domain-containing protein n=1 Tax=Plicaturopsis crispa FD-325 SS-3 TaxID=944288 RepID=A0A0C9SR65_PLICR|nr:hypothetical protein PLICRDRAFT_167971 [Plicaturopsis crispa FD-325 SS-3]
MLQSNDFAAWVEVDNEKLTTYGEETQNSGKTVTGWIPSQAGKAFSVHWKDMAMKRKDLMAGFVSLDGFSCGGNIIRPFHERTGADTAEVKKDCVYTSSTTIRKFTFSQLETTDDDRSLKDTSALKNVGEIEIKVWRVTKGAVRAASYAAVPQSEKVHERSKKAMSHRVGFESAKADRPAPATTVDVNYVDKEPLVTFLFKYRSLDQLKANGIIPPSVGEKRRRASDLEAETVTVDDDDDGDAKRMKALRAEMKAIEARNAKKAKRVKTEPKAEKKFSASTDIIDLT